ncbi:MAG: GGDEF domain-containing protein [Clostridiales bacterium]|nr:GGDEF domain-containing protein [Clostridiales bacterium]
MDSYFLIITVIDVFVLAIMCILTKHNETLQKRQRRLFILSFLLIIAISLLEVVSVAVDKGPASLRWVNIISNYLGFGLTPAIPIILAAALEKNRSTKYALIIEAVYLIFLAISFPLRMIFYVDQNNQYMRGKFFGIFIFIYIAGIIYLLAMTLRVIASYQNKSKTSVYPIIAFVLACTTIQVVFPQVHVTWLCVSLLSILYYTYCNGMWQQLDGLTGLLNQKSYLNLPASFPQGGTLVALDIDDFKHINDTYGHLIGDQCLKEIAACIKKAYSKHGLCYRIGGDEFCVMLGENAEPEACYISLLKELDVRRKALDILPSVAIGSVPFAAGDDILRAKETADNNMYQFKRTRKKQVL